MLVYFGSLERILEFLCCYFNLTLDICWWLTCDATRVAITASLVIQMQFNCLAQDEFGIEAQ
jgi:hypothetical protein